MEDDNYEDMKSFEEISDDERAEMYRNYLNLDPESEKEFITERVKYVMQDRGIDQRTAEKVIRDQNEVAKRLLYQKIKQEKLEEKLKKEVRGTRQWSEEEERWKEFQKETKTKSDEESETTDSRPEFLKTREELEQGIEKGKAIGRGILGIDSREPLKEALISGGAKLLQSLKGKKKTPEDLSREHELRKSRQEYEHKERLERIRNPPEHREREPSFRDLGRGDMGTPRYEVSKPPRTSYKSQTPDFFGDSNQFMLGSNPLGSHSIKIPKRPPSTSIPSVKGRKPPNTKIIAKIKPPSTKIKTIKIKPKFKIKDKIKTTQKYVPIRVEKDIRKKQRRSEDFLGLSNYI